jgi:hypothetical protein
MPSFASPDLFHLDFSKLELPKFDLPKFDLPKFDLPSVDLPSVELPDAALFVGFVRDAAYITVGLAVLGVQEARKRSSELVSTVKNGVDQLRDAVI